MMADAVPNFDDIPSFDDLPDAQQQNAAPSQTAGQVPAFDDIPAFDELPNNTSADQNGPGRPPPVESEGMLASGVRSGAHGIIPTAVGLVGAGAGAALGSFAGPFGTVAGGVGGMVAGAYAGEKLQRFGQDLLGINDDEQMAADAEANPGSTFVGGMVPALATMNPAAAARPLARVAGAGMMGGLEAVQEGFNEGKFDPGKIALATLLGGVFATPNAVGNRFLATGEKAVPGRPNMAPNPAADQAKVDVGSQHVENAVSGSAATQEPPLQRDGSTTGNLQSRPTNSRGEEATGKPDSNYIKRPASEAPENDMLTQGDMDPATAAALAGESERVEPGQATFADEGAPPPVPVPSTADVAGKLQTTREPVPPVQEPRPAAPKTEPVSEPVVPKFDDIVESGFPEVGAPIAVGENEATPMPKRAAAIEVSKANSAKPRLTLGMKPKPAEEVPSTGGVARKLVGETNHNPTEAQKEAGNYEKAGERLLGHDVKYENMKGSVRTGIDAEGKPWESTVPADYGYFKKTIGADKDHVDVYNVGTGDKHFIVDQKNPETGKFDEHKVVVNAHDINEARDTYLKGFSDDKALARLHDIREVDEPALKQWLKTASKKKPYGEPIKAPKAEPKVVTAAVIKLREAGHNEVADAIEKMAPGEERIAATNRALRMMTNKTGTLKTGELKNARIRQPAPEVVGAEGITARSKGDAEKKSAALKAARDIFDQHTPKENETTAETIERARRATLKAAALDKYPFKMQVKQEPALWLAEAKKISKKPSEAKVREFIANEKLLRSSDKNNIDLVRKGNRIESDIGLSRRSGEAAIANAETEQAKKGAFVEDETDLPPKEIRTAKDIVAPSKKRLDMENPIDRTKLAEFFTKDVDKVKGTENAKQQTVAEKMAAQRAAREAAAAARPGEAVPKVDLKVAAEARRRAALERATDEEEEGVPKHGIKDLVDRFRESESGAGHPSKVLEDAKALLKRTTSWIGKRNEPKTYMPRNLEPGSAAEYQSELSDAFKQHDTEQTMHERGVLEYVKALKASIPPAEFARADRNVYFAREESALAARQPGRGWKSRADLTPVEQDLYDKLEGLHAQNEAVGDWIRDFRPDAIGPKTDGPHVYRINAGDAYDPLAQTNGRFKDPLSAVNPLSAYPEGTANERKFFALERGDGRRYVIQPDKQGYHVWDKGRIVQSVKDPTFEFNAGDQIKVGNQTLTMTDAMTKEIERNVKNADTKKPMQYHHSATASAAVANLQLTEQMHHLQFAHDLKNDPRIELFSTKDKNDPRVKDGQFVKTRLGEFDGYYLDKRLAHVMDDYAGAPLLGNNEAIQAARNLSVGVMKTMFWNPIIHPLSVGSHFYPARGWDNFTPRGIKSLPVAMSKAFNAVTHYGTLQREVLANGGSLMHSATVTKDMTKSIFKEVGISARRDPPAWDTIAKKLGITGSSIEKGARAILRPGKALSDAIYDASQRITWASNDLFYLTLYQEHKDKGLSPRGAVRATEKDLPNYRVAPELMGSRGLSQGMQDRLVSGFGPFHTGVANAYANMIKPMIDFRKGADFTPQERLDAVGKLFALAIMGGVMAPLLDKAVQKITGNPDSEVIRRSALAVPHAINKAIHGKGDIQEPMRRLAMGSPLWEAAGQAIRNRDFGDREIISKGDVENAAHGNPQAAARVAESGAGFVARNAIQPIGQAFNTIHKQNGGLGTGVGDFLGLYSNPSAKARKFDANASKKAQQDAVSRFKAGGRDPIEGAMDKELGYGHRLW